METNDNKQNNKRKIKQEKKRKEKQNQNINIKKNMGKYFTAQRDTQERNPRKEEERSKRIVL